MFTSLWKSASRQTPRVQTKAVRLCLESLEERTLLSGGLSGGPGPSGSSGGSGSQQVIVQSSSGGSGNSNLSGPGYPLVSTNGATRTDPGTLSQTDPTIVLMPLSGTPGGSGPTLSIVPVCTGGTSTSGGSGSGL
jgi:hypothetical protein